MTPSPILDAWNALDPHAAPAVAWPRPVVGARVALLLGAFDPITNAHLSIVDAVKRTRSVPTALCMTKVLLARPRDELFAPEQRVRILDDVTRRRNIGLLFANRGTYLDVGRALRATGIDATFVIGSDKIAQLVDPSFYVGGQRGVDATFAELRFIVVPRGGARVDRDDVDVLESTEVFDEATIATLSATDVRRRARRGKRIDHLVPPEVAVALGGYTSAG